MGSYLLEIRASSSAQRVRAPQNKAARNVRRGLLPCDCRPHSGRSVPRATRGKDSWAGFVYTSKLKSFDLQQTMKRKFIRALVVVLAVFAAFGYVNPDDLWDDAAHTPNKMLKESSERLPTHRDRPAVHSSLFTASGKSTYSPSSEARMTSPTLVSLATCVLLC